MNLNGLDIDRISDILDLDDNYVEQVIKFLQKNPTASDLETMKYMNENNMVQ